MGSRGTTNVECPNVRNCGYGPVPFLSVTMHAERVTPQRITWPAVAAAAVAMTLLLPATPLSAQQVSEPPWMFQAFAARKEPAGSPLFGGIGFTRYGRVLGLRVSGAMSLHSTDGQTPQPVPLQSCGRFGCRGYGDGQDPFNITLSGWWAGADLVFEPLRVLPPLKALLLGFSPYGFVGIGGYGFVRTDLPDSSFWTLSYGLGAHHDLIRPFGVQIEARYREPLQSNSGFNTALRENLEYTLGLTVSFGGPSHHKAAPPPHAPPPVVTEESSARFAARVLEVAESYLNAPYLQGGASPYGGFDAAGFVQYVFGRAGVRLPRKAAQIAEMGQGVPLRIGAPRPGDLLFFATQGSTIDHVAIYAGHDRIIHAIANSGVRYDVLGDGDRGRWFTDHLVSARRIAPPLYAAPPDEFLNAPDGPPPPP